MATARAKGLTEAQRDLLRDAQRRPQRVVRGYKPAEKLAAPGFVEIGITEGEYAWTVATTTAGRLALQEAGPEARSPQKETSDA